MIKNQDMTNEQLKEYIIGMQSFFSDNLRKIAKRLEKLEKKITNCSKNEQLEKKKL